MRIIIVISIVWLCSFGKTAAQPSSFPAGYVGQWKGTLTWTSAAKAPQQFTMRLQVQPLDSGRYSWQIMYGDDSSATQKTDTRPYRSIPVDTAKGHWQMDERNSIMLDGYYAANRFVFVFAVQGATIVSSYELVNDQLNIEFISYPSKPIAVTGGSTTDVPPVESFKVSSVQRGILKRVAN